MSLLDTGDEDILIFQEESYLSRDGNMMTRPAEIGIPAKACIQPLAASGTSARRSEQDNEGFESEQNYRLRLRRSQGIVIEGQARIEWRGEYWAVVGDPVHYMGSRNTAHTDYRIRRN